MGITCSSQKSSQQINHKMKTSNTGAREKSQSKSKMNSTKEIVITRGLSYFLKRLDKINQSPKKTHKDQPFLTQFEKQQQLLEWKLECDIVFIIDLTNQANKKRLRLLKELLQEKERHQSRFGIVYFNHNKAQLDLIDDSDETTYDIQKQLSTLKLNDWINIIQTLRQEIQSKKDQKIPQLYVLSEKKQQLINDSILDIVDSLLEETCQKNSLAFSCHSYKIDDNQLSPELVLSFERIE